MGREARGRRAAGLLFRAAVLAGALGACTPAATVPPAPLPGEAVDPVASCGAGALQGLVGQPARVLETMRFAAPVRITRPGDAVTMDYRAERLNLSISEAERIERVFCG